jgi:hypothetical protein
MNEERVYDITIMSPNRTEEGWGGGEDTVTDCARTAKSDDGSERASRKWGRGIKGHES